MNMKNLINSILSNLRKYLVLAVSLIKREQTKTNNPQLSKLIKLRMTYKEIKAKELELLTQKMDLTAKLSSIKYSKFINGREFNETDTNKLRDEIYQIDDLLKGIKFKISEVGFEYEYIVEKVLPKSDGTKEIWVDRQSVILEKKYNLESLSEDDSVELMFLIKVGVNDNLKNIRLVNKSQ